MADTLLAPRRTTGASLATHDPVSNALLRDTYLDADLSESLTSTVEWSEHALESGGTVSDHAVVKPSELSLEGVITRTPFARNVFGQVDPFHMDSALATLEAMRDERIPLLIVTGMRVYDGYVITSMTISRGPEDGQLVKVSLALRPLQIVEAQSVLLPPLPIKKEKKAAAEPPADGGTQSPTDAAADVTPPVEKSILKGGLDGSGITGLFLE